MVQMVRDLLVAGTMYLGFRLSSFRVVGADTVRLVDLGCDVIPLLPSALRHNLERAFLVVEHGGRSDLPVLFWRAFNGEPLPELEGFEQFYRECTR
jgi:creatinine amidohydrolase/Fe(II)-dependent formamide hydrolase-like protein